MLAYSLFLSGTLSERERKFTLKHYRVCLRAFVGLQYLPHFYLKAEMTAYNKKLGSIENNPLISCEATCNSI